ncbi:hypothetical protein P3T76_013567 [Phytophthora citrophthora]|uniref:Uncharacterized protein n=1 Tax=Phytophthora citrophthora TaxID=4793 RepID=A0AAD9G313_9STRA|nr:hypothetical protein P3T76_013567 [Phytophthora citrophthora]
MLNVAIAIAGFILAMLMTAVLLLNVAILMVVAIGALPFWLISLVPDRCWILGLLSCGGVILGYIVLYVYSWFNIYTLFAPHALVLCGLVGYGLFYLSVYLTLLIVKLDARLANFATRTIYSKSTPKELEPEDCVKRFSLASSTDSMGLPIVMMTCRSWVLLLYFSIAKVVVGAMSAATVFFAVVQPAMSLFSGGDGPFYSSSMTLHENPLLYVGIAASTWAFGVVGIVVVAALSVKLAVAVLGEWQLKQTQDGATELPAQTSPRAEFVELSVASPPAAVTPSL